jgi:hypothetical protein
MYERFQNMRHKTRKRSWSIAQTKSHLGVLGFRV